MNIWIEAEPQQLSIKIDDISNTDNFQLLHWQKLNTLIKYINVGVGTHTHS